MTLMGVTLNLINGFLLCLKLFTVTFATACVLGLLIAFGAKKNTLRLAVVFAAVSLVLCGAVYAVELLKHGRVRIRGETLLYPVTFSSVILTAGAVYAACRTTKPNALSHIKNFFK